MYCKRHPFEIFRQFSQQELSQVTHSPTCGGWQLELFSLSWLLGVCLTCEQLTRLLEIWTVYMQIYMLLIVAFLPHFLYLWSLTPSSNSSVNRSAFLSEFQLCSGTNSQSTGNSLSAPLFFQVFFFFISIVPAASGCPPVFPDGCFFLFCSDFKIVICQVLGQITNYSTISKSRALFVCP